jgi:hypothetical protein
MHLNKLLQRIILHLEAYLQEHGISEKRVLAMGTGNNLTDNIIIVVNSHCLIKHKENTFKVLGYIVEKQPLNNNEIDSCSLYELANKSIIIEEFKEYINFGGDLQSKQWLGGNDFGLYLAIEFMAEIKVIDLPEQPILQVKELNINLNNEDIGVNNA